MESKNKFQVSGREVVALVAVLLMSVGANLPDKIPHNLIDRRLLIGTLVAVTVIAMFRYLRMLLVLAITILAFGANLPTEIAQDLGISKMTLLVALAVLVAITLVNRRFQLMPTAAEPDKLEAPDEDDSLVLDRSSAQQLMLASIAKGDLPTVRKLVARRVDVNFTLNGTTPLHVAAEHGYSSIVQFLLECGADVLALNAEHMTALDVALAIKKFAKTTDLLFAATMPHLGKTADVEVA